MFASELARLLAGQMLDAPAPHAALPLDARIDLRPTSNVGRVSGLPPGARVWLTQGAHYHGPLFMLTVATSDSDGALRCCLSVPHPLVDAQLDARFMRALTVQLDAFNR